MKKKVKIVLLIGVVALMAAVLLTACTDKSKKADYDYLVTFDYNVGDMKTNCENQFLGVKSGKTIAIQPGYDSSRFKQYEVTGYFIDGWYTPKIGSDGNVVVNSETKMVELDRKWNFNSDVVNSDITLYAKLVKKVVLNYVDRETDKILKTDTGKPGDKQKKPSAALAPKKDGYTLLGYYANKEGDEEYEFNVFGDADSTVYLEFLKGSWKIVETAAQFNLVAPDAKVYINADLDFSETKWAGTSFSGEIAGNGHKITGINLSMEATKDINSGFGLFNTIKSTAYIHDITFENATITVKAVFAGLYKVGFLAYEAEDGARLTNVVCSGTVNYKDYIDGSSRSDIEVISPIAINGIKPENITNCDFADVQIVNLNNTQSNE